jgi:hypothetical protein
MGWNITKIVIDWDIVAPNTYYRCIINISTDPSRFHEWVNTNLPYVVKLTDVDITKPITNYALCTWIRVYCNGYWARSDIGIVKTNYFFEKRNDALLFKLKWG